MNCSFCFTGTQGLKRNLSFSEIVGQYYILCKYLLDNLLLEIYKHPSIVFMGQGEPLHNFEQLKLSIEYLFNKKTFYLGPRQITVSTSGLVPFILRFNELGGVNLAVSLHSADNNIRDELIPLNRKYPIEELILALKTIKLKKRQFITFEYLLIKDINTDTTAAQKLASRLQGLPAIVNLIPFNPFPGSSYKRPQVFEVEDFKSALVKLKIRTMIRTTKGEDILAACGQLNTV
jgi:23S rRNA (adenine2503-C2)-methyltransferase